MVFKFQMVVDLGTDQLPSVKLKKTKRKQNKKNAPIGHRNTDECHYKSPLVSRTITIVIIIIIILMLHHKGGDFFYFSHVQRVKIDHLAEETLCFLDSPHHVFDCERVQIISCDANPGSSHGDSSFYGYCTLSVSTVCATVQERECLYMCTIMYVFDGEPPRR